VLDWPGEISENMLWELEQALERMPPERILLLTSDQGVFEQASQRLVGRAGGSRDRPIPQRRSFAKIRP
jgi:hypothetical protein